MTSDNLSEVAGRPSFVPAHKLPTSISSEEVLEAIKELSRQGVDKAACWDFTQAVYAIVLRSPASFQGGE